MSTKRTSITNSIMIAALAAALLGGCASSEKEGVSKTSAGAVTKGDELPSPTSKTILKITGDVSNTNHGKTIQLDMATLEAMPTVEATLYEPFLKKDVTFSGVMMEDFLEVIGAGQDAEGVFMTALDDFTADLPMEDLTSGTVMLATRQDGKPLKLRAGGPSRIVFMNQDGLGSNTDMWIWSVDRMEIYR